MCLHWYIQNIYFIHVPQMQMPILFPGKLKFVAMLELSVSHLHENSIFRENMLPTRIFQRGDFKLSP